MKILEIRKTQNGEVAYILDGGKLFKVLVEDLTGGSQIEEQDERPPLQQRVRPAPMPREAGELTIDDIPDDLPLGPRREERPIPELGKAAPPKFKGPIPKGIPRNMVDIFKKPADLA